MNSTDAIAPGVWSVPECAFPIEYTSRVLDDIRLAVMDAFFSLPRGGAEIGGILLGCFRNGRMIISGHTPFPCEHALGPSFTLSPKDHAALAHMVAASKGSQDLQPVGWYHSHTRSEIFLSEADKDIHKRYFPEKWQVALVLKPHTFLPMRAGFFFRGPDGAIHSEASYQEFECSPLPVKAAPRLPLEAPPNWSTAPAPEPAVTVETAVLPQPQRVEPEPVFAVTPKAPERETSGPAAATPAPHSQPDYVPFPSFLQPEPARSRKGFVALLAIACLAAIVVAGFQTRDLWRPALINALGAADVSQLPVNIGLNALETGGQFQIRWDPNSMPVRRGRAATFEILDGGPLPREIRLDAPHLQAGVLSYARQSEKVDVRMTIADEVGRQSQYMASYLGMAPAPAAPEPVAAPAKEREQVAKLKADLAAQTARAARLEQTLDRTRAELRAAQQRRRLENQAPANQ